MLNLMSLWKSNNSCLCLIGLQFPAGQGVEATLSSAAKEGTDMRTLYYAVAAQSYFGLKGIMALMMYLLCIGQEVCIGKNCVCSLNFGLALPSKTRAQFPKLTGLDQLTTFLYQIAIS